MPTETLLLSQVIPPQAVDFELTGLTAKAEVIEHLAAKLEAAGALTSARAFAEAVYERETQGPTFMNFGVAFPHAKSASVRKAAVAFGRSAAGIQYESEFGGGVAHMFFLIAIPEAMEAAAYIDVLKRLARLLMQASFRADALQAKDYAALVEAMQRGEALVQD